jgi:hypothetical protein
VTASLFRELSPEDVRERIRRARRSGFSSWLWPEIPIGDWREAMSEIARATSAVLGGAWRCTLAASNTAAMGLAGYTSGMGPLLGHWIRSGQVTSSAGAEELLCAHLGENRVRMDRLAETAQGIVEELAKAAVDVTVFKGMHTAFSYFPEPAARPLSDIDLYIPPPRIIAAESVLSDMGYAPRLQRGDPYMCDWAKPSLRREPHTLLCLHRDDFWSFDIQNSLSRRLPTNARIELDRLVPACGGGRWPLSPAARVLEQPLLTLLLAAHTAHGLYNSTLLRICELVLVIRKDIAAGALCWESLLAGGDEIGGVRYLYPALFFCEKLVPGTVPEKVLACCRADAPENLRALLPTLDIAELQPLGRHSLRERFLWAGTWSEWLRQLAAELALDPQGRSLERTLRSLGNKVWGLSHRRLKM